MRNPMMLKLLRIYHMVSRSFALVEHHGFFLSLRVNLRMCLNWNI
jgi:hypothetical protein